MSKCCALLALTIILGGSIFGLTFLIQEGTIDNPIDILDQQSEKETLVLPTYTYQLIRAEKSMIGDRCYAMEFQIENTGNKPLQTTSNSFSISSWSLLFNAGNRVIAVGEKSIFSLVDDDVDGFLWATEDFTFSVTFANADPINFTKLDLM